MTSEESVKCANYIAICNLVWKNEAVAEELCGWNQMFVCMGAESHMVPTEDNICLLYMGLFDLCLVQMGRHASQFHTANATITNDPGCDPMTATLCRTNERPDEEASLTAVTL